MHFRTRKISVIGLGYIGLPTAALLASNGYKVVGTDVNCHTVETINQGKIHIAEPYLDAFVRSAVSNGMLKVFLKPQEGDIYIICVPTPFHESPGVPKPNIDYVINAAKSISKYIKPNDLVILESTSPVGTTEKIQSVFIKEGIDINKVHIAYCPERVLPGKIMAELVENDRIVGGLTAEATKEVSNFYRTFVRGEVLETSAKIAEMCKLTENSFRDVNIAFANELSLLCAKDGIDVWELIQLANRHPRVNILQPGAGVGGHCIAVDPWFIVSRDEKNSKLIKAAREVNNFKTQWVIEQIKTAVADRNAKTGVKHKIICFGLAFKPDIDDLRESPALEIAESLFDQGYEVVAVEPNIESHSKLKITAIHDVDWKHSVCAVLIKHKDFLSQDIKQMLLENNVYDFCGVLN